MNRLSLLAAIIVAFVLTGCASVQETINQKRNAIFLIVAEKTNEATKEQGSGIGTGFLIGENEIMTNAHVVGGATKIAVKMENSKLYDATVVAIDPVIDMALVKINDWENFSKENEFSILTLANSRDIKPLDEVYALGNPWGLMFSVSSGVVSHPLRKPESISKILIQTDANIYEGNSGGPLLNSNGEVIGMNSLMVAKTGGSYGFSLHADIIKKVLADWKENGEAKWATIGVSLDDDNTIKEVTDGSPALKSGLKKDDKIVEVRSHNGKFKPENSIETIFYIAITAAENPITIIVKRGDENLEIEITPLYKKSTDFK